jgi:hypothetical protein
VYLVQVSLLFAFYWSAGFETLFQVSPLAFHWLKDCANFTPTPEENDQCRLQSPPLLVQYKQQANPLLTLLSQYKLALTGRNM